MSYEQFVCTFKECVQKMLPESARVEQQRIVKNNGVVQVGLSIREKEEMAAPVIYLEEFYEKYLAGASMEELGGALIALNRRYLAFPAWDYMEILDFQKTKDRIVYKLVNAKLNERLLREVPHLPMFDLAVVFYLVISPENSEKCSLLIRNEHMNYWKQPVSVLYELAKRNTPRLLPVMVKPLSKYVEEITGESIEGTPILMLTNEVYTNGAAAVLYPKVPGWIWKHLGRNYYLLPASVHEFLIVPEYSRINPAHLKEIVWQVNETELAPEDRLSDSIYYFDGESITKI